MKKFKIVNLLFLFFSNSSFGQGLSEGKEVIRFGPNYFSIPGKPLPLNKYENLVEGSPYFNENWLLATIWVNGGSKYYNVPVKLNLHDHNLYFKDSAGTELISTSNINIVVLKNEFSNDSCIFYHYSVLGDGALNKKMEWLQVLHTGKNMLLKGFLKILTETKPYNATIPQQHIQTNKNYGIWVNGKMFWLEKLKDVTAILPTKSAIIENYIANNKLKGKTDADYIKLLKFIEGL